ncbi:hypothetical protein KBB68_03570 [Candidatus Babeliales bacterium]|nr:hypothetical protein [Candidatus Babeliales bacterium]
MLTLEFLAIIAIATIILLTLLFQSLTLVHQAEAESIQKIKSAHPDADPIQYLTALKYIQWLPEMTKGTDNKLIIVPYEASGLANSVASIKKICTEI